MAERHPDPSAFLRKSREELAAIEPRRSNWAAVETWGAGVRPTIAVSLPAHLPQFDSLLQRPKWARGLSGFMAQPGFSPGDAERRASAEKSNDDRLVQDRVAQLLATVDGLLAVSAGTEASMENLSLSQVLLLCDRFHLVATQLRRRHGNRPTLEIADEYDVQDLFHALLKIHFDDVRAEDPAPQHGGASSRVDFQIKEHRLLVEIKRARRGHADREIGAELIQDIARYRSLPEWRDLVCFVYDPDHVITNATGLERDLSQVENSRSVAVVVRSR